MSATDTPAVTVEQAAGFISDENRDQAIVHLGLALIELTHRLEAVETNTAAIVAYFGGPKVTTNDTEECQWRGVDITNEPDPIGDYLKGA